MSLKTKLFLLTSFLIAISVMKPSIADASGTVTGLLTSPTTSVPLANTSISFNLSQAGVDVTQSYNIATTPVTCGTDSTGNVRGITDPLTQLSATSVNTTGSLSGVYYLKYEYYDASGNHTSGSPSVSVNVIGPNNALSITGPSLHPFSAIGYTVWASQVSGSEKLQTTVSGFGSTSITVLSTGGSTISLTNTTVCTLTFNDSIIPPFTSYRVNITNPNGTSVSGYPQNWYLAGSTVNISTIIPVTNQNARFQNPILSNPLSSYATQSINSPLTLNGFALTTGSIIGQSGSLSIIGNTSLTGNLIVTGTQTQIGNETVTGNETISGVLGINTLTPAFKLDIRGTGVSQVRLLDTGIGSASSDGLLIFDQTTGAGLYQQNALPLFIGTSNILHFIYDAVGHEGPVASSGTTTVVPSAGVATLDSGSNDNAGRIVQSSSGATSIGLTFGSTFQNTATIPPSCSAQNETTSQPVRATASTSGLLLTGTIASGDKITYRCERFGP